MSIQTPSSGLASAPQAPDPAQVAEDVRRTLAEDIGSGDVTSELIPVTASTAARVICREPAVLCGAPWFDAVFAELDPKVEIDWRNRDGDALAADDEVCRLQGPARVLLTGERSALNFLQLLSGTATFTRECVQHLEGTATIILDTRKTLPGLRLAQKYAVRCGGGTNHRIGLFDAILIKENHIAAAGSIQAAVAAGRAAHPDLTLEVEVEGLGQLDQAIAAGADVIMLDNFLPADVKAAVDRTAGRAKLEVSGNVEEQTIREFAQLGVDYISIGALTKNVRAVDFSMRFGELGK